MRGDKKYVDFSSYNFWSENSISFKFPHSNLFSIAAMFAKFHYKERIIIFEDFIDVLTPANH